VEWKRNARVAHTKGVAVELQQGSNAATQVIFDDHLEMLGNLHRDPAEANYEKKDYKFSLCDVRRTGGERTRADEAGSLTQLRRYFCKRIGTRQVREKKNRKVLGHVVINLAPYSDVARATKRETFDLEIDSTKILSGTKQSRRPTGLRLRRAR